MHILCNYYVTYRCNAFCSFCHFGDHERYAKTKHARTEEVLENLQVLRKLGIRFIDFTGGEPLLHPDLHLFTAKASELGMTASVTTNALMYPKRAEQLRGSVGLLHFSLDSADPVLHDELRGIACFEAVIESIRIASELGEHPDLLITVTDDNYRQLPGVYELARRHKLLLLINPIFSYFKEETLSDEVMDYIEQFASKPGVYMNPSFLTLRRAGGNDTAKPLCKAVSRVIVISPDNELLLPCYHFHNTKLPIAGKLKQVLDSDEVRWHKFMEGRHSFCSGCAINCYFEPSFAFPVNLTSLRSVPSKIRYGYYKYLRRTIDRVRKTDI